MPYRRGRKSAAQTPAPRSERIKGSKKNPKGTAASKSSAAKIVLSDKTINALSKKVQEYNDKHKNSVSLNTLKAVYRRGLGAYSSSHRPTITGGVPNTRNAWAMARVNKFLMKKAGKKVKAAYVQDDDLLEKGGNVYDDKTLLKKFKQGKSIGFSAEAHLKAKGLLPRVDGTKRKSEKYAEGGLIAPNGKPSNLTPEQYKLVRTPEFKAWFGDWENDPENASKVVDDNGEPLVVYHGTSASFNTFKEEEKGRRGGLNEKFWSFTTNIEQAKIYALDNRVYGSFSTPRIIPAFLNIREMPSYDNQGKFYRELEVWGGYKHIDIFQLQDWHSRGFNMGVEFKEVDGFEVKNTIEMEERADLDKTLLIGNTYYVRNSNQIKLADGTNTTFDANNPDIRFAKGGFNDDKLHKDLQEFLDLEFYSATKYSDVSKSCDLAKGNCYDISEELMAFLKSKGYKNMSLVEVRNPLFDLSDAHYEWVDMPKDKLFHIILKVDDKFIDLTGIQYSKNQEGLKVYTQDEIDTLWGKIEYFEKGGFDDEKSYKDGGETETFFNDDDIPYYKRKGALNVSYLNDEEWKLVTSPEFKQWFGDWQSEKPYSPKSKDVSQVRQWMYYGSYLGEPKIVYHASTDWAGKPYKEFFVFEHGHYSRDAGYFGKGFYFGVSESNVKQYGKYIRKFFLNIRNPYKHGFSVSDEGHPIEFAEELGLDHLLYAPDKYKQERPHPIKEFAQAVQDKLISLGYDGIHIDGKDGEQYVAFYPEQIKLADGTNTTFDANNPDIRFAKGGFNDEVIICSNCLWSWKASESTPEEKYICHKCGHDNTPKTMDKITMDVPLFIRLLEFAREDAKDDMELHTMTENAVSMGDKMLTMEDYDKIVFSKITSSKITKPNKKVVDFPTIEEEFSDGGVVVGKRHSESDENGTGEKFLVQSTGQLVELEGGEGVLCKESMQSKKIYKFEGKEMTGREIASYLNHKYGGVEFAKGGEVDDKSVCGCRSMYYHGGELPSATLDSLKGGEAVVTVKTMESKDKFSFQGRQMTPRKILSHINQDSGGKKFEEGGIIDLTEHHLKNLSKMAKMVSFTEKIFYF